MMNKLNKNMDFRKKNLRGGKVEDLFIFIEILKNKDNKDVIEIIQNYICAEFEYKPNYKK